MLAAVLKLHRFGARIVLQLGCASSHSNASTVYAAGAFSFCLLIGLLCKSFSTPQVLGDLILSAG